VTSNPRTIAQDLIDLYGEFISSLDGQPSFEDRRVTRARKFLDQPAHGRSNWEPPKDGKEAFYCGADVRANPHPAMTVEAMRWTAAWWSANADAYEDHINGD
jgi:hypothetical protein